MPAELVNAVPAVAKMTATDLGALWSLANAFWQGGGVPLDENEATLSALARCYSQQWQRIRTRVIPVWRDIEPDLVRVYGRLKGKLGGKQAQAAYARAVAASTSSAMKREGNGRFVPKEGQSRPRPLRHKQDSSYSTNRSIDGQIIPKRVIRGQNKTFTDTAHNSADTPHTD